MAQYIDETGKILTIEKVTDPFALQELINTEYALNLTPAEQDALKDRDVYQVQILHESHASYLFGKDALNNKLKHLFTDQVLFKLAENLNYNQFWHIAEIKILGNSSDNMFLVALKLKNRNMFAKVTLKNGIMTQVSLRTNQHDFVVNGRQYQALVDGLNVLINEQ